jgi:hypothetical protein
MVIFEARVLGGHFSFQNPCFKYFHVETTQDNDNYKPHAENYSSLSMFTEVIA